MPRFVGLDIHKRVVEGCVLDAAGQVVQRVRTGTSRAELEALGRTVLRPDDRVALEATTNTWAIVRVLTPFVAEVVVSNPLRTRAIADAKVKTDKVDAEVLAQLLRADFLPRVWQPDEATQRLRALTTHRAQLVADRTRLKNRLHAVLHQRLLTPPVTKLFSHAGLAWLATAPLPPEERAAVERTQRLLAAVEAERTALERPLAELGYADARVKLLLTLPGVDLTVAQTLLAALGEVTRFRDGAHAASYLGLVPATRQSADHCHHGPITKAGRGHARWVLVQAAHAVAEHPGPLGAFFRRLAHRKGNPNIAVVATARKLVVLAWHLLTSGEPYRYALPRPTAQKLSRLRVRATGQRRPRGPRAGAARPGPGGGVLVKPLAEVYAAEGLPPTRPLAPGEQAALRRAGVAPFVETLAHAHRRPRRRARSDA
jgi:transposase